MSNHSSLVPENRQIEPRSIKNRKMTQLIDPDYKINQEYLITRVITGIWTRVCQNFGPGLGLTSFYNLIKSSIFPQNL